MREPVNLPQGLSFDMGDKRWMKKSWRITKYKKGDESVSNTTLQNDDHLHFTIQNGEIWEVRYVIFTAAIGALGTAPGIFLQVNAPTSTGKWGIVSEDSGDHELLNRSVSVLGHASTFPILDISALVIGGANETVNLQWCQAAASATATTVKTHSYMVAERMV